MTLPPTYAFIFYICLYLLHIPLPPIHAFTSYICIYFLHIPLPPTYVFISYICLYLLHILLLLTYTFISYIPHMSSLSLTSALYSSQTHLRLDSFAFEGNHSADHRIADECFVVHEFIRGESSDRVEEEIGCGGEVPYSHRVNPFVDLEAVTTVPIPALVDKSVGFVGVMGRKGVAGHYGSVGIMGSGDSAGIVGEDSGCVL